MSELIATKSPGSAFRLQMLATVSALAFFTAVGDADARDEEIRPTLWIELGSQLERQSAEQNIYVPTFLDAFSHLNFSSPLSVQRSPRYSMGGEGKLIIEPKGTNWVFSAGVRYGRSKREASKNQKIPTPITFQLKSKAAGALYTDRQKVLYHLDTSFGAQESHAIADFTAGKDVGIGIFSSSNIALGIRFAQFTEKQSVNLNGVPDFHHYQTKHYAKYGNAKSHHRYYGTFAAKREFQGLGPSLSWQASRALVKDEDHAISMDWGLNVGVLFGHQKIEGAVDETALHYKTFARIIPQLIYSGVNSTVQHHNVVDRAHNVVVPNVGGLAGISFKYSNAKVSLGYRADFFFNAIDGGIDTRKSENRAFYGPYASISIGLGD